MATKTIDHVNGITVNAWGATVGALVPWDKQPGVFLFQYEPAWVKRGIQLSPLHMPLRPAPYSFPSLPSATFRGLPAMIADALPDAFGNALIDSYLTNRGLSKAAITPLDRLAYLGSRAMGALEFKPARSLGGKKPTAIHLNDLVTGARQALHGNFDGDREIHAAISQLLQVGTSAGGQRAKAVVAWNRSTNEIRSGHIDAGDGFDYWLLKLDGVKPVARSEDVEERFAQGEPWGRIEYAYYLMACAAGIPMSESHLLEEGGRAHFITKRFDRANGTRQHVQSLCAMAHLDFTMKAAHDYSQLFDTIYQLGLGPDAAADAFRRMVFNVVARNCDDHTKNHAFLLREGGRWELAPAYDVTHAYSPDSKWVSQHLMSVNGSFTDISRADAEATGERWGVPDMRGIIAQVNDAVANWPEYAKKANVPKSFIDRISADHLLMT